jgi:oligosaccharide reducing-end xylanase
MMIAVQLDKKAEFDALWNWAKTYMYINDPKHPSFGYFSWSCKTDGTPNEETSAPDGEEYFVMSLYCISRPDAGAVAKESITTRRRPTTF